MKYFVILCFYTNTTERITVIGTTHDILDASSKPPTTVQDDLYTVSDGVTHLSEHQGEKVRDKIRVFILFIINN